MSRDSDTSPTGTLGPVDSLSEHVPSEWWEDLFDETYLLTDGDILTEPITRREVDLFVRHASLTPNDRILDLCCGQGRHAIELARRGFSQIQGLDQSTYLIDIARQRAQDAGVDVPFDCGDARHLPFDDDTFDAVLLLGNSFGYFDASSDDRVVLKEVRRVLRPGGRVLLDLTDGDYTRERFAARSWEWVSDQHLVCRERELADDEQRLVAREIIVDATSGVETDQFYSERLYGRREISFLLRQFDFTNLRFSALRGESDRGHDLGLMGHRFILRATLPQHAATTNAVEGAVSSGTASPETRASHLPRYVAVVLGDPRRPDETKQGGRFDDDDYDVVDQLRRALRALPGYEFIYFDDHTTLLEDLGTYGPAVDLVFNLCDEGLRNQPRQELHVPALMDTLDIPYTGAGPQCLAHCYDKSMIRGVAREMNVPIANGFFIPPGPLSDSVPLRFPVIVKPNAADNSAGMTTDCIADSPAELRRAVDAVRQYVGPDRALIAEEFLTGADLTYGVIGNPSSGFHSLPISEDDYARLPSDLPPFCGYEAKWDPDSPYWTDVETIAADLPAATRSRIHEDSHRLFHRLGCRDYARFDWRLDGDGTPHLLEVNPNPGWSWDSHFVEAAAFEGMSYSDVLAAILEAAYVRCEIEARLAE